MSMLTDDAVNLPAVVAGVVVAFLLLTLLIAGIIVGVVVLRRRAYKRGMPSERNVRQQQKTADTAFSRATEGEKGTDVHTYDVVYDGTCTDGRVVLYQGLDVSTQDYVYMYTQLRGGTYQELDPRGREEEHHYQRAYKRDGHGRNDLL